ncbi:MAG: hypothetical protein GY696_05315 [Gammaproteobacteria bacterium]|nr:hypothetical protein [Gammaproteobacteria bacterium]
MNVLPQGLVYSPAAWEKFMAKTFGNIQGVAWWMDDIIVTGQNQVEHDQRLSRVMRIMNKNDLTVQAAKLKLNVQEFEFAGFKITHEGIQPKEENVKAILEMPEPKSKPQVKSFLAMVNFYLAHLEDFATVAEPLRRMERKDADFQFQEEERNAWYKIKDMIATAPILSIFKEECETIVSTDASDYGIGAVLSQIQDGIEKPIAFASKTLSPAERNYSTGEKEALACIWATEKWHYYLYGRHFNIKTDHSCLTALLKRGSKGMAPRRITRWYERLCKYDFEMVYRPGKDNPVADCLSRSPLDVNLPYEPQEENQLVKSIGEILAQTALHRNEIKDGTLKDKDLQEVVRYTTQGWPKANKIKMELKPFKQIQHELYIVDGCLLRDGDRIIIPRTLIKRVVQLAHEAHPGMTKTKQRIRELYWWPGINKAVEDLIRGCSSCQKSDKSAVVLKAPIQAVEYPARPMGKVSIDICGPFATAPLSKKYKNDRDRTAGLGPTTFGLPETSVCRHIKFHRFYQHHISTLTKPVQVKIENISEINLNNILALSNFI